MNMQWRITCCYPAFAVVSSCQFRRGGYVFKLLMLREKPATSEGNDRNGLSEYSEK